MSRNIAADRPAARGADVARPARLDTGHSKCPPALTVAEFRWQTVQCNGVAAERPIRSQRAMAKAGGQRIRIR